MVNIPGASGGFGVSQIPSDALFNDPALMRRYRLAEIMSQSALGGPAPRTGFEALARAVQAGVGGHIASQADQAIQDRQTAANDTYSRALKAAQGAPAMTDYTDAQGTERDIAAQPGGADAAFQVLGTNRDTAKAGNMMALNQLIQRDTMKEQLAKALAEQRGLNPILAERTGMTGAAEIPNAVAKQQALIPGQVAEQSAMLPGRLAEQRGLNPILAERGAQLQAAEMPFVGPKAEAAATGTAKGQLTGFMGSPPTQALSAISGEQVPSVSAPKPVGQIGTNEEYLASLNPGIAGTVKGISEGRIPVSPQMVRTPQGMALLDAVNKYDPSFDAVNYQSRAKARAAFTSGAESKMLNATNTVMGHMDEFEKAATALNNSDYPLVNKAINTMGAQVSPDLKARLNRYDITKQAVVSELERAYRGSGGSQADIEAWKKTFDNADSPQAMRASLQQGTKLLSSKIEALGEQYNKGMGTTKQPFELLNPKAAETYKRLLSDGDAGLPQIQGGSVRATPDQIQAEMKRRGLL